MCTVGRMIVTVFFIVFNISLASASQPFDINGDGQEGLPEAIHALQVSSGLAPTASVAGYDLADYMVVDGGEYLYEYQAKNQIPQRSGSELVNVTRFLGPGDTEQIIQNYQHGMKKIYWAVSPEQVLSQGEDRNIGLVSEYLYRSQPDVIMGSRDMHPGDAFIDMYLIDYTCTTEGYDCHPRAGQSNYQGHEYVFVGLENVTVPAGTFSNCLKIVRKIYTLGNPNTVSLTIYYFAEGIGLVKRAYPGFVTELSIAKIGNQVYPTNATIVQGEGDWSDDYNNSDRFYLSYNPADSPIYTSITLINFLGSPYPTNYNLKSTDGINFAPDPDYYDGVNFFAPNLSLTIENNTINGTMDGYFTLTGTY